MLSAFASMPAGEAEEGAAPVSFTGGSLSDASLLTSSLAGFDGIGAGVSSGGLGTGVGSSGICAELGFSPSSAASSLSSLCLALSFENGSVPLPSGVVLRSSAISARIVARGVQYLARVSASTCA